MSQSYLTEEEASFLESASRTYPQPVAFACGQILRSRTEIAKVDAVIKAGEIVARYLAALGLASIAHRQDASLPFFDTAYLSGNIAFGNFLRTIQFAAGFEGEHLLKPYLIAGFPRKAGTGDSGKDANTGLLGILNLRNELGHDIARLNKARAMMILKNAKPQCLLIQSMKKLRRLLSLPIFVMEQQRLVGGEVVGERLTLMGEELDPRLEIVELDGHVKSDLVPYLAVGSEAVKIFPFMVWEVSEQISEYRLFVLDSLTRQRVKYKSVNGGSIDQFQNVALINRIFDGATLIADKIANRNGANFVDEWQQHHSKFSLQKQSSESAGHSSLRKLAVGKKMRASLKSGAFEMFANGMNIEDVASKLGRALSTTEHYCADYLTYVGAVDPSPWVDADTFDLVRSVSEVCGTELLKPIFLELDGRVSYREIRLAVRCLKNEFE